MLRTSAVLLLLLSAIYTATPVSAAWLDSGSCVSRAVKQALSLGQTSRGTGFTRDLQEGRLSQLQDQSLREALGAHGTDVPQGQSARQALVARSAENRERLGAAATYRPTAEMRETERLVEQLEFFFPHNSHHLSKAPSPYMVSARRIKQLGVPLDVMQTGVFNTEYLRTDDQIFFFVVPKLRGQKIKGYESEYGSKAVMLKPEYAKDHGWVSLYVMHPSELEGIARQHAKNALEQAEAALAARGFNEGSYRTIGTDFPAAYRLAPRELDSVRAGLGRFDLTLDDFA